MRFSRLWSHMSMRVLVVVTLMALTFVGVNMGPMSQGTVASARSTRNAPIAVATKVMSLSLTTTLRLVGRPGHVDYAKGNVTGNFAGTTSVRFVAIGSTGGEATFTIYPTSGGSLIGRSVTHGHVVGPTAYFSGTASITGGTGRWAHAHGTGLGYSGSLDRQNYHSTSVMHGSIRV